MAESDDFTVTIQDWVDCNTAGNSYCVPGVKALCAAHGINFKQFLKDGVHYSRISHIKNPMLQKVVAQARKRTFGDPV